MSQDASSEFLDVLLYKANKDFIEGNRAQPVNAQEIWDNLEDYFGPPPSKITLWRNGIVGLILITLNIGFGCVILFGFMHIFGIERLNLRIASLIGGVGFVIGVLLTTGILKLLPVSPFVIPRYTFAERESIYGTLCEAAEVVNGTIVAVASLPGYAMITYTVKSPTYEVIRKTYTTKITRYTRSDIGKEVAVLYLNEVVNVLL